MRLRTHALVISTEAFKRGEAPVRHLFTIQKALRDDVGRRGGAFRV